MFYVITVIQQNCVCYARGAGGRGKVQTHPIKFYLNKYYLYTVGYIVQLWLGWCIVLQKRYFVYTTRILIVHWTCLILQIIHFIHTASTKYLMLLNLQRVYGWVGGFMMSAPISHFIIGHGFNILSGGIFLIRSSFQILY